MTTYRYFVATDAGDLAAFARLALDRAAVRLGSSPAVILANPADLAELQAAELGVKVDPNRYVARRGLMIGGERVP